MKRILYIHIGNHKTATTIIQHFSYNNFEKLKKFDLIYPKIGIPTGLFGHHNFAWEMTEDKKYNVNFGNISKFESAFKLNKNLLISSEDFESLKFNGSINKLLKMASKYDYEIKIILVIRKQESLFVSLIKEITRSGAEIQNIDIMISNILKKGYLDFLNWRFWFDYKLQLNKIYHIFKIDKKSICLLWYNKENLLNNFFNLIFEASILDKINNELSQNELSQYESLLINKSMSDLSFQMLNYFNYIRKNYEIDKSRYKIIKRILVNNKVFFSKDINILSKDQKKIIINHFKASNTSVINEFK